MPRILYIGGNVVDWNAEIDKTDLGKLANFGKDIKGDFFKFISHQIFKIRNRSSVIYLYLYPDKQTRFDKNPEDSSTWGIEQTLAANEQQTGEFESLRRPGGGATTNIHVAGTLAASIGSPISLELLVLEESNFVRATLENELVGANFNYYFFRKFGRELDNVSFRCNGRKITYTSVEKEVQEQERQELEKKLGERFNFSADDFLVVNSVKDREYLDAILRCYDSRNVKPALIAAVTSSMLARRAKLDVEGLIERADIYISNIEELYDLLKDTEFSHRGSHQELDEDDLYNSMKHVLTKMGRKKKRVYVTCGDHGAAVMDYDGNLYFQRTSGLIESPTQKNPVVDLNGSGDTFAGAAALLEAERGYNVIEMLDYSNAAAQICVTKEGANGKGRITADEIRHFRKYHSQNIWKYSHKSSGKNKFENHCSVRCNLK